MIEWGLLGALTVLVFWTVWRAHFTTLGADDVSSMAAARVIWQNRLADLKQRRDELTPRRYALELDRIRAGVLADSGDGERVDAQGPKVVALALSLVAVFGATLWGYQQFGGMNQVRYTLDGQALQGELDRAESLEQAIGLVEDSLNRFDSPERYFLLGQLHEQGGALADAHRQFSRARELAELDVQYEPVLSEFLAWEAQTLLFSDRDQVERVAALAERALTLNAEETVALGVMGVLGFELRDFEMAAEYWQRLLALTPADSPDRAVIAQGLAAAREALGQGGPSLKLVIERQPELVVDPNTPVFVYARMAPDQPAPLVVARVRFGDLPTRLVLTDEMRMGPMGGLAGNDRVEVVARVALGGTVAPQAGDWQGSVADVEIAADTVTRVVIDTPL
ncbi:hypothetical protein GH975_05395 [Litorivicinus lipolyticus]|uniref:Cytochrome c-type biogenesis protein H Ig-like domain-containing protein n=1 Tax=Litorivicinus lipolyticus TaxID=418701 RepID=A0A5Q2QCJ1_9GAMM|nr:hypothetical protein [Litorivicinus lipolyticus]QGG80041.1 hypothetical protein GH975_05395 [Litorivicinus lipolyticus]